MAYNPYATYAPNSPEVMSGNAPPAYRQIEGYFAPRMEDESNWGSAYTDASGTRYQDVQSYLDKLKDPAELAKFSPEQLQDARLMTAGANAQGLAPEQYLNSISNQLNFTGFETEFDPLALAAFAAMTAGLGGFATGALAGGLGGTAGVGGLAEGGLAAGLGAEGALGGGIGSGLTAEGVGGVTFGDLMAPSNLFPNSLSGGIEGSGLLGAGEGATGALGAGEGAVTAGGTSTGALTPNASGFNWANPFGSGPPGMSSVLQGVTGSGSDVADALSGGQMIPDKGTLTADGGFWSNLFGGGGGGFGGLGGGSIWPSLIGGGIQGLGSWLGANKLQDAQEQANQLQWMMYNQNRADLAPYREAGYGALGNLTNLTTPGKQIDAMMLDPGYQFRYDEGMNQLRNQLAAGGKMFSGDALRAGQQYGQGFASNEFGNIFNRNAALAGIGQTATGQGVTANTAASEMLAGGITGLGNAQAAGITGLTNAIGGGLQSGYNQQQQNQLLALLLAQQQRNQNPIIG